MKRNLILAAVALSVGLGATASYAYPKDKNGRHCRSSDRFWWWWGECKRT